MYDFQSPLGDCQARSPASESSDGKSLASGGCADPEADVRLTDDEMEDRIEGSLPTQVDDGGERNMREYEESAMQELLAMYGFGGGELGKNASKQMTANFFNNALVATATTTTPELQRQSNEQSSKFSLERYFYREFKISFF